MAELALFWFQIILELTRNSFHSLPTENFSIIRDNWQYRKWKDENDSTFIIGKLLCQRVAGTGGVASDLVRPAAVRLTAAVSESHTILPLQPTKRLEGRTYADYESRNEGMEGVGKMYEEHLKRMNPNSRSITYNISQLFDFIDDMADLSCLVY
ncbi:hypothetical protein ACRRTK_020436 [Alexandromys fortis]